MQVALHPEGVDRNKANLVKPTWADNVALHPEGVDRNDASDGMEIECFAVALHPEGVDRNQNETVSTQEMRVSPSTRRAWIEIVEQDYDTEKNPESPSTRRAWIEIFLSLHFIIP